MIVIEHFDSVCGILTKDGEFIIRNVMMHEESNEGIRSLNKSNVFFNSSNGSYYMFETDFGSNKMNEQIIAMKTHLITRAYCDALEAKKSGGEKAIEAERLIRVLEKHMTDKADGSDKWVRFVQVFYDTDKKEFTVNPRIEHTSVIKRYYEKKLLDDGFSVSHPCLDKWECLCYPPDVRKCKIAILEVIKKSLECQNGYDMRMWDDKIKECDQNIADFQSKRKPAMNP